MASKVSVTLDNSMSQILIPRVKKYLEENVDKAYIDVGEMANKLRQRYTEYSSRPQNKFRKSVEEAYRVVSISYGLGGNGSSNDGSDDDVKLMDDEPLEKNLMKNIMNELYNKPQNQAKESTARAEAIDISSDDDDVDTTNTTSATPKKADQNPSKVADAVDNDAAVKNFLSRITVSVSGNNTTTNGNSKKILNSSIGQKRRESSRTDGQPAKKFISNQQRLHELHENPVTSAIEKYRSEGVVQPSKKNPAPKKYKKHVSIHTSTITFQNMGGIEKQLKELCEILIHLKVPDIYYEIGVVPPRGILLYGPSGCGKTMLASAIAGQLNMDLIKVPATELIAGVSGESEERIRDIFEQAKSAAPCVLFIDEIDTISTNRLQAQKEMERRIVSQLISSIDSLRADTSLTDVVLIGATSRPDALDPALRRDGRFDHEIGLSIPNRKERKEILRVVCDGMRIDSKLDYDKIAELTPGYVGADLVALSSRAATIAVKKKWMEQMHKLQGERPITIVDLVDTDETMLEDGKENGTGDEKQKQGEEEEKKEEDDKLEKNNDTSDENKATDSKEISANKDAEISTELNGDQMEIDKEEPELVKDEENKTVEKNFTEPTLAEMMNWLDLPPEDLDLDDFCITLDDFCEAIKIMQPSAKREGFITVPDVTWDDIGSLRDIREELRLAILAPVKYPDVMMRIGLQSPSGVLLCGPPGCGKTLIAKAIANEAGINFISVKGPELMNMYVGESERAVRDCFQRARNSAPCVIFFDEFDSLCPKRSQTNEGSSGTRIVNQLLTEMDGIQERKGVYIMAASNRPDIIDPAILRPGRLDSILYVGMPEANDRHEILLAATKNRKNPMLAEDVDLMDIAQRTDGYSGADLTGLLRQASMLALKDSFEQGTQIDELYVHKSNFDQALELVRPSISESDRKIYDNLRAKYAAPRRSKQ